MKKGNTFGFTAFVSYGSFWLFYAMLVTFGYMGFIQLADLTAAIGTSLILWGILTLYLWIPATTVSLSHNLVFLGLWITFFVLGAGDLLIAGGSSAGATVKQAGGYLGILTAIFAAYTSFAIVTNSVVGKGTIPLGPGFHRKRPTAVAVPEPVKAGTR